MKAFKAVLSDKSRKSKWLPVMAGKQLFKFENLLARPVQQIPKYEMLLKELNKHTDDSHPEKLSIARAIAKVHDVAIKNDLAIDGNGLIWQHQDMCHWTNFSDAHSRQLSLSHASGVTKTKIATSSTSFFIVNLKTMSCKCSAQGSGNGKQCIRYVVRSPSAAQHRKLPVVCVVTTPSLVEKIRTTTDGQSVRLRVPGAGWLPLTPEQLADFLLAKPRLFSRTGNKCRWLLSSMQWDVGVVKPGNSIK